MRAITSSTVAAFLALSAPAAARADDVPPVPPPGPAVDLRSIDLVTILAGAGGLGRFDAPGAGSSELMIGVQGAAIDFLGLRANAVTFEALGRPSLDGIDLYGNVLTVDAFMFGSKFPTSHFCTAFVTDRCDESTGYFGLSEELASVHVVPSIDRREVRVTSTELVVSPTPAFQPDWARYRLLFRAGASVDSIAKRGFDSHAWFERLSVGIDGALTFGPLQLRPGVRWRPRFQAFVDDYGIEARVDAEARFPWSGLLDRSNVSIGGAIVYEHWSVPDTAFGADRITGATDTLTARIVIAPSLLSVMR